MEDDPKVIELRRKLTPEQKLKTAARELKAAALRSFHPDWPEEKIRDEVTRIFSEKVEG
jgi:hypothetical protein